MWLLTIHIILSIKLGKRATGKVISWIAVKIRHSLHSECPYFNVHLQ